MPWSQLRKVAVLASRRQDLDMKIEIQNNLRVRKEYTIHGGDIREEIDGKKANSRDAVGQDDFQP
jgi:hypothetical protein